MKLVNCGDFEGYIGVVFEPLNSLFEIEDDEEGEKIFKWKNAGSVILGNIEENLQKLGSLLEGKLGDFDVMTAQDDKLKRPRKIQIIK